MRTNFYLKTIFFLILSISFTHQMQAQCEFDMGPITVTHGNGQITMSGSASQYHYQVFDENNGYYQMLNCQYCGSSETLSGLSSNGNYLVRVTNENWTASWENSLVLGTSPCNSSSSCELTAGPVTVDYDNGEIIMSGTGAQYHYQVFDKNNGYYQMLNCQYCGNSETLSGLSNTGDYLVRLTNENWTASWDFDVSFPCSSSNREMNDAEDSFDKNSITLYPNPAKDLLHIRMDGVSEEKGQISIYNTLGQEVHLQEIGGDDYLEIDVSNFDIGMYFMSVKTEKASVIKQFIVAK